MRLAHGTDAPRVEVSDTRTANASPCPATGSRPVARSSGRGLLVVAGPATRWAVAPREGAPGRTVRAELALA